MIKNYIKIAWRNIRRNKFFSTINVLGLALGMACSILILLWVQYELSIDSFHSPRLYQVFERQYYDNKITRQYSTPGILAAEMKNIIPDVEYAVNLDNEHQATFRVGDKILKLEGSYTDSDFFKMFTYPLLQGNPQTALNTPISIAISRKMAEEFFGSPQAAINKTIRFENKKDFTVTAVFENPPENSSQKFDFLINWQEFLNQNDWVKHWDNNGPSTYILLRAKANPGVVNKKVTHFIDAYFKRPNNAFRVELGLIKFGDVYLHSDFDNGNNGSGRITYVHLFSIIAVFILLIACINYMNLMTARSIKRAKEIGVRKVVGAVRSILVGQFMGEALTLTFIAAFLSIILVIILLPVFNSITQKQIAYPFDQIHFWMGILGLTCLTGLISGSYPALFLSSFNPVKVLKNTVKISRNNTLLRKGLVIFQFVLSILLIIGTIVISNQVNYIQKKNLGYDRENLIYIPLEGDLATKYKIFKDNALNLPGVQQVTWMSEPPIEFGISTTRVKWKGKDPNTAIKFRQISVGYDFVRIMKLQMQSGRDYSRDFSTDSLNYLINETALQRIGYIDPIGKSLTNWGREGKILGVLKDFHFSSLHEPIQPLIVRLRENEPYGNILVRTQPGQTIQALASIEKLCKDLNSNFTFNYYFIDAEYQKLYNNEQMIGKLSEAFAFLAIFISCLGLLGLAMFTAEQRVKEIGIRKVLGAGIGSLLGLLSKDFLILVLIALMIASPIAWFTMYKWLENYAYRTCIDWWVFGLSGMIIMAIAMLTVSFQSIKAAMMNPVKSLKAD